jgi:hypothetical protein
VVGFFLESSQYRGELLSPHRSDLAAHKVKDGSHRDAESFHGGMMVVVSSTMGGSLSLVRLDNTETR